MRFLSKSIWPERQDHQKTGRLNKELKQADCFGIRSSLLTLSLTAIYVLTAPALQALPLRQYTCMLEIEALKNLSVDKKVQIDSLNKKIDNKIESIRAKELFYYAQYLNSLKQLTGTSNKVFGKDKTSFLMSLIDPANPRVLKSSAGCDISKYYGERLAFNPNLPIHVIPDKVNCNVVPLTSGSVRDKRLARQYELKRKRLIRSLTGRIVSIRKQLDNKNELTSQRVLCEDARKSVFLPVPSGPLGVKIINADKSDFVADTKVTGTFFVRAITSADVASVRFVIDGVPMSTVDKNPPFDLYLDTFALTDPKTPNHKLGVTVTDAKGASKTIADVNFIVDNPVIGPLTVSGGSPAVKGVANTDFGITAFGGENTRAVAFYYLKDLPDVDRATETRSITAISFDGLTAPFSFPDGKTTYPPAEGSCRKEVKADCTTVLMFKPTASSPGGVYDKDKNVLTFTNDVTIKYTFGTEAKEVKLKLVGQAPLANVYDTLTGNFGSSSGTFIEVGQTTTGTMTFYLTAGQEATNLTFSGFTPADVGLSMGAVTCPDSKVTDHQNCSVEVRYTPKAAGESKATFNYSYKLENGEIRTAKHEVSAYARVQGALSAKVVYDSSWGTKPENGTDIGGVGTGTIVLSLPTGTRVKNIDLTGTGMGFPAGTPFNFEPSTDCKGATLTVGASCTIPIKFSPTAVGTFNANFTFGWTAESGETKSGTIAIEGVCAKK